MKVGLGIKTVDPKAVYLLDLVAACQPARAAAHPPGLEAGCRRDLEAECPQAQVGGYPLDQEVASQLAREGGYLPDPGVDCRLAQMAVFPLVLEEGCLLGQRLIIAIFLHGLFSLMNWRNEGCTHMQSLFADIYRMFSTPS